ncbi:M16 family metallopeptidase [Thermodesulfobacteriota bacterium]
MPDDANPLVSVRIACLGGKRFEGKENEGLMNFIANMIDKGAGSMSEVDIDRKIEDMGGRLRGFSGYDSFGLTATFFSRCLNDGLQLLSTIYSDPTFPEDKMDRERRLILNSIKTEPDRPFLFALKNFNETLFRDHPYGLDKLGTVATVAGFTRNDLSEMYKRYAVSSNTVISIVGDFDPDKTLDTIRKLFGKVPGQPLESPDVPAEKPLDKPREKTIKLPRAKAHIILGFPASAFDSEDRYALEALNNILAGQGGRLFVQLRDKESLAYQVTSLYMPHMDPGAFAFYIACDAAKVDKATEGILREIGRIRESPVGSEELDRSITNLIGSHEIALQSTSARAENTALNTLYDLGYDYEEKYVERISAVKSEAVQKVAKKYLDLDRCVIVKILPEDK